MISKSEYSGKVGIIIPREKLAKYEVVKTARPNLFQKHASGWARIGLGQVGRKE